MISTFLIRPGWLRLAGFLSLHTILFAQPPAEWTVNSTDYEFMMTVTGRISIDGGDSVDPEDVLAAFHGTECRGQIPGAVVGDGLEWFLSVYGDVYKEEITFKVWDASTDMIIESSESEFFSPYGCLGSVDDPYPVEVLSIDNTLPVELSWFRTTPDSRSILLEWQTESETENLGFILERRIDVLFIDWEVIADFQSDLDLAGQGSITEATTYRYHDTNLKEATTYEYRLADVSYAGDINYHESLVVRSVHSPELSLNCSPNPFNAATVISYILPTRGDLSLKIYDLSGRVVTEKIILNQPAGPGSIVWDSKNDVGENVATSAYLCRIQADNYHRTIKIAFLK